MNSTAAIIEALQNLNSKGIVKAYGKEVNGELVITIHSPGISVGAAICYMKQAENNNGAKQKRNKEITNLFNEESNRGGVKPTGHSFERTQYDYNGKHE